MAKKYDYSNIEFAKRIKLRRDIMTLNRVISGIKYSIGYPANVFIYISEKYYNQNRGEIVEGYPEGANPIDYLNSKALYQYREYLNDIILHWEEKKLNLVEFKPTDFSVSIEECAKVARLRAKELDALPHNNLSKTKLPKNITGSMLKKVDYTLKQANISDTEFNDIITANRRSTHKPRAQKPTPINKTDVKDAVKEAMEELGFDTTDKEKTNKVREVKDINLFNYEEVYNLKNKKSFSSQNTTKKEATLDEKVEWLQKQVNQKEKFLKEVLSAMNDNSSVERQLRAQDYYDSRFNAEMQKLMNMQKELKELIKQQDQNKSRER